MCASALSVGLHMLKVCLSKQEGDSESMVCVCVYGASLHLQPKFVCVQMCTKHTESYYVIS